jgi:hypothetical protein
LASSTPKDSLPGGIIPIPDPSKIDPALTKIGVQRTSQIRLFSFHPLIHNLTDWANHGICGRGVLLDLVRYHTSSKGANATTKDLPYDPWTTHSISVAELQKVAEAQGVTFRQGDILILRVGFIKKFNESAVAERQALGGRPETLAGIEQSEEMKRFLWCVVICCNRLLVSRCEDLIDDSMYWSLVNRDNHFAAIASDQPALEVSYLILHFGWNSYISIGLANSRWNASYASGKIDLSSRHELLIQMTMNVILDYHSV